MTAEKQCRRGLVITSHGDRRTRPSWQEKGQINPGGLWLMAAVNRWNKEGISLQEIEERVGRLVAVSHEKLTGTMTLAQMSRAIEEEAADPKPREKRLAFQGTFLDDGGIMAGLCSKTEEESASGFFRSSPGTLEES